MEREKAITVLNCMADVLKDNGFRVELVQTQGDTHPPLLRVEQQRVGKIMQDILIEMCFIPMQMPGEGVALLQYYVTLFTGLPQERAQETKRAVAHCNDYCALGAFGYFVPAGQLYLKHNTLLPLEDDLQKTITFMADNLSLVLASVARFIDAFAAISNGIMTVDVAIEQELLPRL